MIYLTFKEFFLSKDIYQEPQPFMFTYKHLLLILGVVLIIGVLLFILPKKSRKGIFITKLFLIINLLVFELLRIFRHGFIYYNEHGNLVGFDWVLAISFQMCAISTWTTIFSLSLGLFINKDNKYLQLLYNFLCGCAAIGALTTFMFPGQISKFHPFFRFTNLQTIIIHILLVLTPLYLIKIGEFKPEVRNLFNCLTGYMYVGAIAMTASLCSGHNFAFSLGMNEIPFLNQIFFPFHLLLVIGSLSFLAFLFYKIYSFKHPKNRVDYFSNEYRLESLSVGFYTLVILSVIASILGKNSFSSLGLLCLIPLFYLLFLTIFITFKMDKKVSLGEVIFTFILNLFLGILYLKRYRLAN